MNRIHCTKDDIPLYRRKTDKSVVQAVQVPEVVRTTDDLRTLDALKELINPEWSISIKNSAVYIEDGTVEIAGPNNFIVRRVGTGQSASYSSVPYSEHHFSAGFTPLTKAAETPAIEAYFPIAYEDVHVHCFPSGQQDLSILVYEDAYGKLWAIHMRNAAIKAVLEKETRKQQIEAIRKEHHDQINSW